MAVFWFTQSVDDENQTVCLTSENWDMMADGEYTLIASFQKTVADLVLKDYRNSLINHWGKENVCEGDFL